MVNIVLSLNDGTEYPMKDVKFYNLREVFHTEFVSEGKNKTKLVLQARPGSIVQITGTL